MTTKVDGTNGIIFPDSTTQSTAAYNFGTGQTWQDLSGSRSVGTTYTNSTGKPISVSVSISAGSTNWGVYLTIGGIRIANYIGHQAGAQGWVGGIVPNGITYSLTNINGANTINAWAELR